MELSERKKAILSAVIRMYIESGEPIGSKILSEMMQNSPSSATLRNEMSALCDMGFLEQPHTSAGRVPTPAGYRLYIESLMNHCALSSSYRKTIDAALESAGRDPEKMPEKAVEILSEITGLPAIAAKILNVGVVLCKAELIPLGKHSGMVLIITSDGRSRSRLCHISEVLGADIVGMFNKVSAQYLLGNNIDGFTPVLIQNIIAGCGRDALELMPLILAVFEMAGEIGSSSVSIKGMSHLFSMGFQSEDADRIISTLNSRDTLLSLMKGKSKPLNIVFGRDTEYPALNPSSIIFARYGPAESSLGCIGVIGPTRMSYEQIIPGIEYTALKINSLLCEAFKDMEEHNIVRK